MQPAGRFAEFQGVDPSLDPELADAIRISLEEAKQQEQRKAEVKPEGANGGD